MRRTGEQILSHCTYQGDKLAIDYVNKVLEWSFRLTGAALTDFIKVARRFIEVVDRNTQGFGEGEKCLGGRIVIIVEFQT